MSEALNKKYLWSNVKSLYIKLKKQDVNVDIGNGISKPDTHSTIGLNIVAWKTCD